MPAGIQSLLLILIPFALLFWLMSRQRKQQKEAVSVQSSIKVGQEVMTASGMYGTIRSISDDEIILETMPGQLSRWTRRAVVKVVTPPAEDGTDAPPQDPVDPTHPTGP